MKTINIYITLAAAMLWVAGCTKAPLDTAPELQDGELVGVTLKMDIAPYSFPTTNPTKSTVVAREQVGGLVVELIENPEGAPTKADVSGMVDGWIFQFDSQKRLNYKQFFPGQFASQTKTRLIPGKNQTIAIIFGADSEMGNSLILGASTFADLQGMAVTVTSPRDLYQSTGGDLGYTVLENASIAEGMVINMPIVRYSVAIVSMVAASITMEPAKIPMNIGMVSARYRNVPSKSYYLPDSESEVFPSQDIIEELATVDYPEMVQDINPNYENPEALIGFPLNDITGERFRIPVNRRGVVAGTTAENRVRFAPKGSTYLELKLETSEKTITYSIPLGENLTTDYSLKPGTEYRYRIVLGEDPNNLDDSRVETHEKGYVGMFGGPIIEVSPGVFQYPEKLYVDKTDLPAGTYWGLDGVSLPQGELSESDGKHNTLYLTGNYGDAAKAAADCFSKNKPYAGTNPWLYQWFLPSVEELLAVLITQNGLTDVDPFLTGTNAASCYLSSTILALGKQDPYGVSIVRFSGLAIKRTEGAVHVRCVKRLKSLVGTY